MCLFSCGEIPISNFMFKSESQMCDTVFILLLVLLMAWGIWREFLSWVNSYERCTVVTYFHLFLLPEKTWS